MGMTKRWGMNVAVTIVVATSHLVACGRDDAPAPLEAEPAVAAETSLQAQPAPHRGGPHCGPLGSPPPAGTVRLIAPLSGSLSSTNQPLLRWELGDGAEGAIVELCADRDCNRVIEHLAGTTSATPSRPLRASRVFWRARATREGRRTDSDASSATWLLFLPSHTAPRTTAVGTRVDVNGDGFADFVTDDRVLLGGPRGLGRASLAMLPTRPNTTMTAGVAAGDVDGNGLTDVMRMDFLVPPAPLEPNWQPDLMLSNGTGFDVGVAEEALTLLGGINNMGPAGDLNGDGYGDLLATFYSPSTGAQVLTFYGSPIGLISGIADPPLSGFLSYFGVDGDFDGDGFSDVVNISNGVPIVLAFGGTTPFLRTSPVAGTTGVPLAHVVPVLFDSNFDGFADLGYIDPAEDALALLRGGPSGPSGVPFQTFLAGPCGSEICPDNTAEATGDFNGDGLLDLILGRGNGDQAGFATELHLGVAGGTFDPNGTTLPVPFTALVEQSRGGVGDVNGDGIDDVVVGVYADAVTDSVSPLVSVQVFTGSRRGLVPGPTIPLSP